MFFLYACLATSVFFFSKKEGANRERSVNLRRRESRSSLTYIFIPNVVHEVPLSASEYIKQLQKTHRFTNQLQLEHLRDDIALSFMNMLIYNLERNMGNKNCIVEMKDGKKIEKRYFKKIYSETVAKDFYFLERGKY